MNWQAFDGGKSIGLVGSEGGFIVRDEEQAAGARITLEQTTKVAPFAITCGIYGWMCHTRFFDDERQAHLEFECMSQELSKIIATLHLKSDSAMDTKMQPVVELISKFVERFP